MGAVYDRRLSASAEGSEREESVRLGGLAREQRSDGDVLDPPQVDARSPGQLVVQADERATVETSRGPHQHSLRLKRHQAK